MEMYWQRRQVTVKITVRPLRYLRIRRRQSGDLGYQFFKVYDESQLEYIVVAKGEAEDVYMIGKIVVFQIQNLLVAYKERYDKDNFIKNLLLDNLLLVDIFNRAKKLHIEMNARRVVYIVETSKEKDNGALETVRSMFAGGNKDFSRQWMRKTSLS